MKSLACSKKDLWGSYHMSSSKSTECPFLTGSVSVDTIATSIMISLDLFINPNPTLLEAACVSFWS